MSDAANNFESQYLISRYLPPLAVEYQDNKYHLLLRPFQADDLEQFVPALLKTLPSLYKYTPWPLKRWDEKDCLLWLTERHGEYFLGKVFEWGCFDKNTGEFLLSIGIMPAPSWNPDCWELGYWTVSDHTGRGLATLASQIVIALAFECLQIQRLQVGCMKENKASKRVIEKAGFLFEGELRGEHAPPTKERLALGAIAAKTDLLYALLPGDRSQLTWYQSLINSTYISSLLRKKFLLAALV
jgi:RimJ/RimL family protein N-acetyltransferase